MKYEFLGANVVHPNSMEEAIAPSTGINFRFRWAVAAGDYLGFVNLVKINIVNYPLDHNKLRIL